MLKWQKLWILIWLKRPDLWEYHTYTEILWRKLAFDQHLGKEHIINSWKNIRLVSLQLVICVYMTQVIFNLSMLSFLIFTDMQLLSKKVATHQSLEIYSCALLERVWGLGIDFLHLYQGVYLWRGRSDILGVFLGRDVTILSEYRSIALTVFQKPNHHNELDITMILSRE